ncbi:MAG: asparagine synthase (glutamine-hydrolyzing), partial [Acetobacteraceae bacterium]
MCGITGHWARSGEDLGAEVFRDFTDRLAHRGPDGRGEEYFPAERLRLGHRRLAILDLSERGRQPMSTASGRYWLTFNGEIYNFIELRQTLVTRGYRFFSECDSEVILAAYREWGPDCQLLFNGMWAFGIWDSEARMLFLSRDRFGIKPLYYAEKNGSFCFASELKAFLALPWCDGSFAEDALALSIADMTGQEIPDATLLPDVQRLPPGHCLTVTRNTLECRRWWNTLEHLPSAPRSLEDQAAQFRNLFLDACRVRLRSDVSIATSLSGGLDSS